MYFPAIKKAIQGLEEKLFYRIAIFYLENLGYTGLSIVDGAGDGGRDVVCDRENLRIQLSVRKDWETKINEESSKTASEGKSHLIYITNRAISPIAEQNFLGEKYKNPGVVDLSIHDLSRISTSLTRPGAILKAYEMLGMKIPNHITADPKEIALSSVLLFSTEAKELRDEVIEAAIRSSLFRNGEKKLSEKHIVSEVAKLLPWNNSDRFVASAFSRLRAKGRIKGGKETPKLSEAEFELMQVAETEVLTARLVDIKMLVDELAITETVAEKLLDLSLELLVRNRELNGLGPREEELSEYLASNGLTRKRLRVYDALSKTSSAKIKQHGATIDHICETNTFDIYRALGRQTDLAVVLDASVAMPVVCGLSFGHAASRYGVAAVALKKTCEAHGINLVVPESYLNEMASHGLKALEFLEVYNQLPAEAKKPLRESGNAYLSHYTHISSIMKESGDDLTLKEFLAYFGIKAGTPIRRVENSIRSILENLGVTVVPDVRYDKSILEDLAFEKKSDPPILIEHDARVCTMIKNDNNHGYVLATWDKAVVRVLEGIVRVYADNPGRIIDFLGMAKGVNSEVEKSYDLLSSLLHMDERKSEKLALAIEKIKSSEQVYKLKAIVDVARSNSAADWELRAEDVYPLLDVEPYEEPEKE